MKPRIYYPALFGVAISISFSSVARIVIAEESAKKVEPQPLRLVGGEVVRVLVLPRAEILQLDTSQAGITLLKVKNRFGLEEAVRVLPGTTITRNDREVSAENVQVGDIADIEYNMDFQSMERTAVSIKILSQQPQTESASP